MSQEYKTFLKIGQEYQPVPASLATRALPPGIYSVKYDQRHDQVSFCEAKVNHDELVDLPGTAYDRVLADLEYFFTDECSRRFVSAGLMKKMNILLHGVPGGGKTCIVDRVAYKMISEGGIVLFDPSPVALAEIYRVLDLLQPETPVLIIYEELDQLIRKYNEEIFLHVLDGELQKSNVMFIATTNYIDKIPKRIKRPGRFPVRVEVGLPGLEARLHYCGLKLANTEHSRDDLATKIAEATNGFTIDQLKDVIRSVYCMQKPFDATIAHLRQEFGITAAGPTNTEESESDGDWEECDTEEAALPVILGQHHDGEEAAQE